MMGGKTNYTARVQGWGQRADQLAALVAKL
jgi:hypothetical protein